MEDKRKKDWLFWVFLIVSVIWAIIVFWLLLDDQYFHNDLNKMDLNEVGDFLAGSFSPLAFFWLAYGYWMQNRELINNNKAIQLQIDELRATTKLSNRNLNLQEEQWKIKKALDHNKAQPELSFDESYFTVNTKGIGQYTISTRIHNNGANISKLSLGLYSFNEKNPDKIKPILIPTVPRGSSKEVIFEFESDIDPKDSMIVLALPVRYEDENSFSQTATLIIRLTLEDYIWQVTFDFDGIKMDPA